MNFLAHLALAGPDDSSRIGNILGDFEKGTPESISQRLPQAVVDGIIMHRRIDRFTDDHVIFHEAKNLLAPERRRFAGIIVDIFFDHFLSNHWQTYHPGTVSEFIEQVHQLFDRHPTWLGSHFGPLVPRLRTENWLASYASLEGQAATLHRIADRSPKLAPLRDGVDDLSHNYQQFEKSFLSFYPEAREYAAHLLKKNSLETPSFP